jgi:hypothetical protein
MIPDSHGGKSAIRLSYGTTSVGLEPTIQISGRYKAVHVEDSKESAIT